MEKELKALGIIVLVLLGILIIVPILKPLFANKEDIFDGVITNIKLGPVKLSGIGVYDRSCISHENGLTNCDAGIQTEKGLLNFNYKHNMQKQQCISEGDKLEVEILDADGNARVRRLI